MTLIDLINSRTVSTYELAEKTGVSRQTINNIVKGKTKPSFLTVKKICSYFGTDYRLWTNVK